MKLVGHPTESIYRLYAIADSVVLKEAAIKLAALQANEATDPLIRRWCRCRG
jgi:hypothetical protein